MNRARFFQLSGALLLTPSTAKLIALPESNEIKLRHGVVWKNKVFQGKTFYGPGTINLVEYNNFTLNRLWFEYPREKSNVHVYASHCTFIDCYFKNITIYIHNEHPWSLGV